jgi:alkanesulfonate monooxygenase SsuD/methylene tetrahydromethanopterin reductase-like flavin-dependent oxidoreductase (luciferase family)
MRFGLFGGARTDPGEQASDSRIYTDYIDYICEAEQLGFHSVFLVEHHFTGFGQVSATLNFLTYLAAKTTVMRLGTAVLVLPWHNPALLAEQVATLDLLSDGRFDFGVGRGYRDTEFDGFCIPITEATERFEETMAFLHKAWAATGRFSHQGKFWNLAAKLGKDSIGHGWADAGQARERRGVLVLNRAGHFAHRSHHGTQGFLYSHSID